MTTIANQAVQQPVKASSFYSFTVVVDDDDVYSWTPPGSNGFIFVSTTGSANWGTAWFRTSLISLMSNGSNFDKTTGVLTGTTGVDGQVTLSVDSGTFYLENRLGSQNEWTILVMCENSATE